MNDYKLEIINAAFIASGIAIQAKGVFYGTKPDNGRDAQKEEEYGLGTLPAQSMPSASNGGSAPVAMEEELWCGSGDYWLGRYALTDLVVEVPGKGSLLINDVTMNVSLQKEVVRTALVGHRGTIKEYVTEGDYQISMSVGLVAVNDSGEVIDQYPERAMTQLREILEIGEALEVSSAFLDVFGVSHIVVTGFSAKQMTHSNRQVIEITALSDDEYVIESTEY